jgi:multidrug efflux pump subunit AcrA (membrane-fusion protein)
MAETRASPPDTQEELDLVELGRTWKAPPSDDMAPEVSDILQEAPSWATRGLLYIVLGFVVAGLLWASLSSIDMVAVARGTLVPEGYVRPVQAAAAGMVQAVLAREGDAVEAGQALLQLDATEPRTRLSNLREELATSEEQLRQLFAARAPVDDILAKQNRIAQLQSDAAAMEMALAHTTLTAPVGGVVTSLSVRGPGAMVQAGQTVAVIAPEGTRLVAEVRLPNRDVAFVAKGLPARLKFDAFPFQDYGIVRGTLLDIAPDAQPDEQLGSYYRVTIVPAERAIMVRSRPIPLRPGLALTAEIITERKNLLMLFLEPFRKLKGGMQIPQ